MDKTYILIIYFCLIGEASSFWFREDDGQVEADQERRLNPTHRHGHVVQLNEEDGEYYDDYDYDDDYDNDFFYPDGPEVEIPPNENDNQIDIEHESHSVHNNSLVERNEIVREFESYVRNQSMKMEILRQLGMDRIPNITMPVEDLPTPILAQANQLKEEMMQRDQEQAKRNQKIKQLAIFGEKVADCFESHPFPSRSFEFKIKDEIAANEIEHAELWIKVRESQNKTTQNFDIKLKDVRPLTFDAKKSSFFLTETHDSGSEWIRLDIKHTVRRWINLSHRNQRRIMEVACSNCAPDLPFPFESQGGNRPFIMITPKEEASRRHKRSTGWCQPGSIGCCKTSWTFNFKENGMDFILTPDEFAPNDCSGSCNIFAAPETLGDDSMHTTISQWANRTTCCTPSKLESLQVILINSEGIIVTTHLKIIAQECDCR